MQFAADQAIAALPKLLKDDVDRLRAVNLVMDISGPHEDMDPATIAMFKRIQWILRTVPHDWNEPVGERPAAPAAMPPALAQETNSHAGASGNGHTAGQPLNAEMAAAPAGKGFIMMRENKIYEEIAVGDEATIQRVLTANDLFIFARASGNLNPMHLPQNGNDESPEIVAPSMWVGALISSVLGNVLPGAGTLYKSQTLKFIDRAHVGDELSVKVRVRAKQPGNLIVLDTIVTRRNGDLIAEGVAEVLAPVRKIALDDGQIPELVVARHRHFDSLIEKARKLPPLRTAVVAPEEAHALKGAIMAAELGIIDPVLTGNRSRIEAAAKAAGCNISGYELVEAESTHEAAAKAVALVLEGRAQSLMKGHLHTDEVLHEVVKKDGGLRGQRRLSHVFVMDVPGLENMLLISDAAINIAPTLEEKVDITQNAIDLALALGMKQPRVGVLSAVETVTPKIPSTLDAAILSKMAERGQILGGVVDGPLAMDNAIDMEAAKTKGITSLVAGRAEILIVPNLESGNMLAKELTFIAHADSAGIVLGAKVPVILTSRADNEKARLASCAVAALYRAWQHSSAGARREAA
ncbi:MAG: bifunctional enoyl-CoA hydratase/phosphate acetyltransferase [Rhodomicrobium sp.]